MKNLAHPEPVVHRLALIFLLGIIPFARPTLADEPARPGGFPPLEAAKRMVVPEGFRVEVFASEPEIRQPVAAAFDERGRVWVVEYIQYPSPEGLKPVSVDEYLRTEYDRVPEPPPHGPRGADRIRILEDTNGDGRADKFTTFVDGLNLASAVAVGYGGVFVAQAPYLLFYPDKDRDDVPDGDPEVLLKGFGLQDAHAVVNSLTWGPDGWLYGAQGSTVTAKIRGHEFQQGIWRYHPVTKKFELFAEGGGNTWGLDFDRLGRAYGSSNGHFITFHMVQGGYYWKGFAKHGPLHNPRTYGYFESIAYQGNKPGGHVTPGGIIYKGDAYPDSFQDTFIGANLLSNTIYWHNLQPKGSTVQGSYGGTLADARDFWFRPIALATGPDGNILVVDWYDQRASHLDPRDNWDKSNGRIYRIAHGDRKPVEPFDLASWSSDDLVELRTHQNDWWPETARRILAERRDPSVIPKLKQLLDEDQEETLALRDLWALDASGGVDEEYARELLDHPLASVRRWAIRLIGDHHWMNSDFRERLIAISKEETDPLTRSQLAASCQRWPALDSVAILEGLARREENLEDEHIPMLIWWAIEKALRSEPLLVVERFGHSEMQAERLVREVLLERIARALASDGSFDLVAKLFEESPDSKSAQALRDGVEKGLEGRSLAEVPEPLRPILENLWSNSDRDLGLIRFAVRLGSLPAYQEAARIASETSTAPGSRAPLIELLGQVKQAEGNATLLAILGRDEPAAILQATLNALGSYNDPEIADTILARYSEWPASLQNRAIDRLISRKTWAIRLLDAMGAGMVATSDLSTSQASQIARLEDAELLSRLTEVWGALPSSNSEAMTQRIAEVRGILPEGDKGNAARGAPIFQQNCAGCHTLFGQGEQIGPDLNGVERGNLTFLLESIVDPNAIIRKEYQPQTIATRDGRVISGLIVEESDQAITLFDSNQEKTVIPRSEIEEVATSNVSIMPEGLLDDLPDDQIRDLFRYLQSSGPPK